MSTAVTRAARATGVAIFSGSVYVGGYTALTSTGVANANGFIRKYDESGNKLWGHIVATSNLDYVDAVAAGHSGVYVSGDTTGTFRAQHSLGGTDEFLRAYSPGGRLLWTRQFGTGACRRARSSVGTQPGVNSPSRIGSAAREATTAPGSGWMPRAFTWRDRRRGRSRGRRRSAAVTPSS